MMQDRRFRWAFPKDRHHEMDAFFLSPPSFSPAGICTGQGPLLRHWLYRGCRTGISDQILSLCNVIQDAWLLFWERMVRRGSNSKGGRGLISGRRPGPPNRALRGLQGIFDGRGLSLKNRPRPLTQQTSPERPMDLARRERRRAVGGRFRGIQGPAGRNFAGFWFFVNLFAIFAFTRQATTGEFGRRLLFNCADGAVCTETKGTKTINYGN